MALCFFLLFWSSNAGDLKKVMKAYEKGDWVKTEDIIKKALANDPVNPGVRYYYSLLYSNDTYIKSNLDSARVQIRQAIADYESAPVEMLEEMVKEGFNSSSLLDQLSVVTDWYYEVAEHEMTIEKWDQFINLFADAPQLQAAIDTRDSLALEDAKSIGTIDAWKQFLFNYPDSKYRDLVITKRDSLMVSGYIKNHNELQLKNYVSANRGNEIAEMALAHLLKLWTKSGSEASFVAFIDEYADDKAANIAVDWLFHIDKENAFENFDVYSHINTDSIEAVRAWERAIYFPVYDEGYSLVSATKENKKLALSSLSSDIICNGWTTDVIAGNQDGMPVILSRQGSMIIEGELLSDLGYGLLLVGIEGTKSIYHKTGRIVIADIDDAEIIQGKVIKVKKSNWGLISLMGLPLADYRFDEIFVDGNFWFFKKDDLIATATYKQIIDAFPEGLFLEFKFEDYELISNDELIGFREDRECLQTSDGSFRVPWGRHQIYPSDSLGYIHDDQGYKLYGHSQNTYFPYLEANAGFVLSMNREKIWTLYSNMAKWSAVYQDSVRLLNPYFALSIGAERKLLFHNQTEYTLKETQRPFVFSPQSKHLLLKDKISQVVNYEGKVVFSGNFDEIRLLGDSLFSISFRGKHGLISASGKEILPIRYEYIDSNEGMISMLLNGKIGAVDLIRNVQFEPTLESKPERVGRYYKVVKNGKYGLLDSLQQVVVPFNYDQLDMWSQTSVWVKEGDKYSLFDIEGANNLMEVTLLSPLSENGDLYRFYNKSGFGIIHRTLGVIVPPDFTDVRLLGTNGLGVLMAEQALKEAGFYVLTYYTLQGEKIFSHAYRREDYEKVFCDDW